MNLPIEIIYKILEYTEISKTIYLLRMLKMEIPKKIKRRLINDHILDAPMFCFFCKKRTEIKYWDKLADSCYECFMRQNC